MRRPERRNRNIGTKGSGYSQDNEFKIPETWIDRYGQYSLFYERIQPSLIHKDKLGESFVTFCYEKPLEGYSYGCNISDVKRVLLNLKDSVPEFPPLVVFRQPTQKQQTVQPVWGRFIYNYESRNSTAEELNGEFSAIVIEAQKIGASLIWNKKMSLEDRKEFDRLVFDGHVFEEQKRAWKATLTNETIRSTILYRTVIHELGHWKQYCENVIFSRTSLGRDWDESWDLHHSQPVQEKEQFAHRFADENAKNLLKNGRIPFDPLEEVAN